MSILLRLESEKCCYKKAFETVIWKERKKKIDHPFFTFLTEKGVERLQDFRYRPGENLTLGSVRSFELRLKLS